MPYPDPDDQLQRNFFFSLEDQHDEPFSGRIDISQKISSLETQIEMQEEARRKTVRGHVHTDEEFEDGRTVLNRGIGWIS